MEYLNHLKTEELVAWMTSFEARNKVLPSLIPDHQPQKESPVEARYLSVLNGSSITWSNQENPDPLSIIGMKNVANCIISRLEIPFKNPLLERIRQALQKSYDKYGHFNVIRVEANSPTPDVGHNNKKNKTEHYMVCSCGCDQLNKVCCSFPWAELMVLRKFKENIDQSSMTSVSSKATKKIKGKPHLQYGVKQKVVDPEEMFRKAQADTKKDIKEMFKTQKRQMRQRYKKAQEKQRYRFQLQSNRILKDLKYSENSRIDEPQFQGNVSWASQQPPLESHLPNTPYYNCAGSTETNYFIDEDCNLVPPFIMTNCVPLSNKEYLGSSYELFPFEGENISHMREPITAEEQSWLNTQIDLEKTESQSDYEKRLFEMGDCDLEFENTTQQEIDKDLHMFEFDKISGMSTSIAEEESFSIPHNFATQFGTFMEYPYLDSYYQHEVPRSNYGFKCHDYAVSPYTASMRYQNQQVEDDYDELGEEAAGDKDSLLLIAKAAETYLPNNMFLQSSVRGLRNFHADWSYETEDESCRVSQQPFVKAVKIAGVCPPPGFTIEDRNQTKNEIEDFVAQKEKRHVNSSVIRMQNLSRAEKRLGEEIGKMNGSHIKISESEGLKTPALILQRKVKEIFKEDEKPSQGTETFWHHKIITTAPENSIQVSRIQLPPDLNEFPTLNQAHGVERAQSRTVKKIVSSERLCLPFEVTRPNNIAKFSKSSCESRDHESVSTITIDDGEPTKLTAAETLRTLFSLRPKSNAVSDGFDIKAEEFQKLRCGPGPEINTVSPEMQKLVLVSGTERAVKSPIPILMDVDLNSDLSFKSSSVKPLAKLPSLMEIEIDIPSPPSNTLMLSHSVDSQNSLFQLKGMSSQFSDSLKSATKSTCQSLGSFVSNITSEPLRDIKPNELPAEVNDATDVLKTRQIEAEENKEANRLYSLMFANAPERKITESVLLVQTKKYIEAHQSGLDEHVILLSHGSIELRSVSSLRGRRLDGKIMEVDEVTSSNGNGTAYGKEVEAELLPFQ